MGSDAQITRTSEFPASVQVEDMRKAVGAARREFFTSSGHYAKDVAKSLREGGEREAGATASAETGADAAGEARREERRGQDAHHRGRAQHRYSGCHESHRRSR